MLGARNSSVAVVIVSMVAGALCGCVASPGQGPRDGARTTSWPERDTPSGGLIPGQLPRGSGASVAVRTGY